MRAKLRGGVRVVGLELGWDHGWVDDGMALAELEQHYLHARNKKCYIDIPGRDWLGQATRIKLQRDAARCGEKVSLQGLAAPNPPVGGFDVRIDEALQAWSVVTEYIHGYIHAVFASLLPLRTYSVVDANHGFIRHGGSALSFHSSLIMHAACGVQTACERHANRCYSTSTLRCALGSFAVSSPRMN